MTPESEILHRLPPGSAWLFCPADRPERYAKAAAAADVVVLDLEDGVSPQSRPAAREALLSAREQIDPSRTVLRISPKGTSDHVSDLQLLENLPFKTVMLAKTEDPGSIGVLHQRGLSTVALCETPRGVTRALDIASTPGCSAVMWGAEDLIAGLGGTSSRDSGGLYRDVARFARSQVLLAGASAGTPVLDSVFLDIPNLEGLRQESEDAVASGFAAKVCIHPSQVSVVRESFSPGPEQIAWARGVTEAHRRSGHGVFSHNGQMIDEPLLRQARRIIERAELS